MRARVFQTEGVRKACLATRDSGVLLELRRYNPNKGELTLVCEKYPDREENRRDILDTLHALVAGKPADCSLGLLAMVQAITHQWHALFSVGYVEW